MYLRAVQPVPSPIDPFPLTGRVWDEFMNFSVRVGRSVAAVSGFRTLFCWYELMDCFVRKGRRGTAIAGSPQPRAEC